MGTESGTRATSRALSRRLLACPSLKRAGVGAASVVSAGLLLAGTAQAATAPVNLGSAASFSVLAGSTVTNTGPTTMSGNLGLDPGSAITGAPVALGTTHVDDAVALSAQNSLTAGMTDAAGRPATQLASADLSGQSFTPGVYDASSSLLFSAGDVTLNAQGNPNAVFIFQVGSSLTTGSGTTVLLTNGAQSCNVFWQIGASATLGTNSIFAGTVMASTTITADTGATLAGRLLASTGAVNLESNTITTTACAAGTGGTTGSPPGTTGTGTTTGSKGTTVAQRKKAAKAKAAKVKAAKAKQAKAKKAKAKRRHEAAERRAAAKRRAHHHVHPRPPRTTRSFTG